LCLLKKENFGVENDEETKIVVDNLSEQIRFLIESTKVLYEVKLESQTTKLCLFRYEPKGLVVLLPKMQKTVDVLWDFLLNDSMDENQEVISSKKEEKKLKPKKNNVLKNIISQHFDSYKKENQFNANNNSRQRNEDFKSLISSKLWFNSCNILQKYFLYSSAHSNKQTKEHFSVKLQDVLFNDSKFSFILCSDALSKAKDGYIKGNSSLYTSREHFSKLKHVLEYFYNKTR
jgi:hypothetical protein